MKVQPPGGTNSHPLGSWTCPEGFGAVAMVGDESMWPKSGPCGLTMGLHPRVEKLVTLVALKQH